MMKLFGMLRIDVFFPMKNWFMRLKSRKERTCLISERIKTSLRGIKKI
jgi:hypothetical protein